uniref:Uncharacterized protein n=1 Tax=Arcella intermedia TaxID=1963864 RepID=A0A6B2L5H0_9EUKA
MSIDKALFPIAGKEMLYHPIAACSRVPGLKEVYVLGYFPGEQFTTFIENTSKELNIKITYLQEEKPLGTAGGLFHFGQVITKGREYFFVLHVDVCCSFPLVQLLNCHKQRASQFCVTMMGTKVDKVAAPTYGCYVADENGKMVHYAEHPESFISNTINAGVYVFNCSVVTRKFIKKKTDPYNLLRKSFDFQEDDEVISMERDLLPGLVNEGKLCAFEYNDFWRSIKNPGGAVYANDQYMKWYMNTKAIQLTTPQTAKCEVVGDVIIHSSAQVDPSAKIGPNVYIGPNTTVGAGARVHNSIVLNNVKIKEHACVMYAIIGNDSIVGIWSRVEGLPNATDAIVEGRDTRFRRLGITVIGNGVTVHPEIIIRNCIVMPHKPIKATVVDEIIL